MTKPSPRDRRGEPPAIQIRPSNERPKTLIRQTLPEEAGSVNRTVVGLVMQFAQMGLEIRRLQENKLHNGGMMDQYNSELKDLTDSYSNLNKKILETQEQQEKSRKDLEEQTQPVFAVHGQTR
jgi:hypothetical protein